MERIKGKLIYYGRRESDLLEIKPNVDSFKYNINHLLHVLDDLNSYSEEDFLDKIDDDFIENRIIAVKSYSNKICSALESLKEY